MSEDTETKANDAVAGPVDPLVIPEFERFSQGVAGDGPAILKEGKPMTPDEIVNELNTLTDALAFYADPDTYFAIGFFPDPPCGDFINDFTETTALGAKPGKVARAALGIEEV